VQPSVSDLCFCFPPPAELARLAENARAGRKEAFVGTGSPDTVLACGHGSWPLGDVLAGLEGGAGPGGCTKPKADGSPCQGRAGEDGRCAAHKEDG